jgi:hypothetical protein
MPVGLSDHAFLSGIVVHNITAYAISLGYPLLLCMLHDPLCILLGSKPVVAIIGHTSYVMIVKCKVHVFILFMYFI